MNARMLENRKEAVIYFNVELFHKSTALQRLVGTFFFLSPEIGWYHKVVGLKIDIKHRPVGGLKKNKNGVCEHTEIPDHIRKGEQTADHSLRISDEYHTNYPLFVVNPRPLTLDLNLKNMIVTLNLSCRLCLLTFCLYWWGRMTMGEINYELGMTYVR